MSENQINKTWAMKRAFNIGLVALVAAALIQLTGCMTAPNGFSQFYQDRIGSSITNLPPYSGITKVVTSMSTNEVQDLFRNNYVLIGSSAFQGPPESEDTLVSQAKKVGADVVLFSSTYLGSQQTVVPWVQYNPGQTYTTTESGTVNANTWGSNGNTYGTGNYYGNSTTTTPGTYNTQMVPVTVQRYQYEAGFFRKAKSPILGIRYIPLPPEIRQQLERNTGVLAWVVINDSPAFDANILEGDVILGLNGQDVISMKDFSDKLHQFAGHKVDLGIWRNGRLKTISVQLNNAP